MSVLDGRPVLDWVNIPVPVVPDDKQFVIVVTESPQQVPLSVTLAPPSLVMFTPRVAVVVVMAVTEVVSTVGGFTTKYDALPLVLQAPVEYGV